MVKSQSQYVILKFFDYILDRNNQFYFPIKKMKKYQDKSITLHLRQFSQTKTINIDCSVHTNIHAIKILICKLLKLTPLQTNIQIFYSGSLPLKATSTLLQNGIIKDSQLLIKVKTRGLSIKDGIEQKQSLILKKQVLQNGFSVKYYCKNQKCINFMKDSVVNLGFGQFDLKKSIDKLSCQLCPYKSQKIHVPVGCRDFIIRNCFFSIKTIQHIDEMIFKEIQGQWIKSKDEKKITRRLILNDNEVGKILIVKMI